MNSDGVFKLMNYKVVFRHPTREMELIVTPPYLTLRGFPAPEYGTHAVVYEQTMASEPYRGRTVLSFLKSKDLEHHDIIMVSRGPFFNWGDVKSLTRVVRGEIPWWTRLGIRLD